MKKIILSILGVAMFLAPSVFAKESKIGYVDVLLVFNEYEKTKEYEKNLDSKKQAQEQESNLTEKKEAIIKMQDKIALLKEKEQEKEREKIRAAITEYRELEGKIYNELKQESDERMKEVLDDITKAVEEYARKNDFRLILNRGAVLYGADGIDVTEEILGQLNKGYKKGAKK